MTNSAARPADQIFAARAVKLNELSWQPWSHNSMVQYRVSDGNVRIRFKSKDARIGWVRPFSGSLDETIRSHLRNMANGRTG